MAISTMLADQVCQHKLVNAEFDMHDTRKCCLQRKANILIKLQKKTFKDNEERNDRRPVHMIDLSLFWIKRKLCKWLSYQK